MRVDRPGPAGPHPAFRHLAFGESPLESSPEGEGFENPALRENETTVPHSKSRLSGTAGHTLRNVRGHPGGFASRGLWDCDTLPLPSRLSACTLTYL